MKNNQPINNKQAHFKEGSNLVSVTDLNGVIEYVNNNFVEISGFSEEELVGQNHHIVRHPDMPEGAFADLWETIKADGEWRGIVKNRCKDGGYYWVDAYVIPIFKDGKKIGYQSVRSVPTKKQINEAEALYAKMRNDKNLKIPKKRSWSDINMAKKINTGVVIILLLMAVLITLTMSNAQHAETLLSEQITQLSGQVEQQQKLQASLTTLEDSHSTVYTLTSFISFVIIYLWWLVNSSLIKPIVQLRALLRKMSEGDLSQTIDAKSNDELGQTTLTIKLLQARLRTIFEQFTSTTQSLTSSADGVSSSSHNMQTSMQKQSDETNLVATAMNEMLSSVGEVSNNALNASQETTTADADAENGEMVVNNAHAAMTTLTDEVKKTAKVIDELAEDSSKISSITDTISSIAEQTNLLALNAAIEAARAGDQGRGFAVVADEVRSLALRTQEATSEIRSMLDNLHGGINGAVTAMEGNIQQVTVALNEVETSKESFNNIRIAVMKINDMNSQIATAAEEQQQVSEEMNQNIQSISDQSNEANSEANGLQQNAMALNEVALELQTQLNTLNLGISATDFDFDGAKQAHLAWKTRVRSYLDGDHSVITKEQACSHRDCKLGQWYYGEGQKNYGENASFKQIEAPHEQLHKVIKDIVNITEEGNKLEAEALYKEIEPLSKEIVGLIDQTKNAI